MLCKAPIVIVVLGLVCVGGTSAQATDLCVRITGADRAVIVTACGETPANIDPFKDSGVTSLPFTMECVAKDSNGNCVKSQCKKDATSGCADYASGCLKHDGYYAGTDDSGTCSKIL
jgi:hypothetical protein